MKRVLAALIGVALFASLASAQNVTTAYKTMKFRHHAAAVVGTDEWGLGGWTVAYDSTQACGNGTNLVDTTETFNPSDMAIHLPTLVAATDTLMATFKAFVTQLPGTYIPGGTTAVPTADVNAVTLTLQGSADNQTWATIQAAASSTTPGADPQKVAQLDFKMGPVGAWGWQKYRFILTGIANTTGCFQLVVAYPKVVAR